uniref:Uncharacterized protein n=1 Tax=Sipha flava TaxID=143950 RepID=A0A2S2R9H4_9HEMI
MYTNRHCLNIHHYEGKFLRTAKISHPPKLLSKFLSSTLTMNHNRIITFSILYFSSAWVAQSTASCCISSDISAFLITALRSDIFEYYITEKSTKQLIKNVDVGKNYRFC